MTLIGKEPEIISYLTNTAKLFVALMRETNADTSTNTVDIVHHESGDKYKVKLIIERSGV